MDKIIPEETIDALAKIFETGESFISLYRYHEGRGRGWEGTQSYEEDMKQVNEAAGEFKSALDLLINQAIDKRLLELGIINEPK